MINPIRRTVKAIVFGGVINKLPTAKYPTTSIAKLKGEIKEESMISTNLAEKKYKTPKEKIPAVT